MHFLTTFIKHLAFTKNPVSYCTF